LSRFGAEQAGKRGGGDKSESGVTSRLEEIKSIGLAGEQRPA